MSKKAFLEAIRCEVANYQQARQAAAQTAAQTATEAHVRDAEERKASNRRAASQRTQLRRAQSAVLKKHIQPLLNVFKSVSNTAGRPCFDVSVAKPFGAWTEIFIVNTSIMVDPDNDRLKIILPNAKGTIMLGPVKVEPAELEAELAAWAVEVEPKAMAGLVKKNGQLKR